MVEAVITLDTSAIYALIDRLDPDHARVRDGLMTDPGPYVVPATVLCEVGYLVERRLGTEVLLAFLDDLRAGSFSLDCGEQDLTRMGELVSRYRNLPLGIADAAVIACAERSGGNVLTLDRRHFDIVTRDVPLRVLPA